MESTMLGLQAQEAEPSHPRGHGLRVPGMQGHEATRAILHQCPEKKTGSLDLTCMRVSVVYRVWQTAREVVNV